MEKICTMCKKLLPLLAFHSNKGKKDGRASACRNCCNSTYKTEAAKIQRFESRRRRVKDTMWQKAKTRAKRDNLPFNIKVDDIEIPEVCPVFGIKLQIGTGKAEPCSPSLDKIVPELGYIKGNIQVISFKANTMKSNASHDELVRFANWILKEQNG